MEVLAASNTMAITLLMDTASTSETSVSCHLKRTWLSICLFSTDMQDKSYDHCSDLIAEKYVKL
jgi:hypothetical protein